MLIKILNSRDRFGLNPSSNSNNRLMVGRKPCYLPEGASDFIRQRIAAHQPAHRMLDLLRPKPSRTIQRLFFTKEVRLPALQDNAFPVNGQYISLRISKRLIKGLKKR
jgi:hypothetical protein